MDGERFDRIVRGLPTVGRRGGLRALLGGAIALSLGGRDAGARRRRRRKCLPPCATGFACEKGVCVCPGGVTCDGLCCEAGQVCLYYGTCSWPPVCHELGDPCKATGRRCCQGLTCASGQGGMGDVACYKPAGAACASTAECVYDATCIGGECVANPHPTPPRDPYAGTCTRQDNSCITKFGQFVDGKLDPRIVNGVVCTTIWGEPGHCYLTSSGEAYCAGFDPCASSIPRSCTSDAECRTRLGDLTAVCVQCGRCGGDSMCIGTESGG